MPGRPWSEGEDYFLIDNPQMTAREIGAALGRSQNSVHMHRRELVKRGVNVPPSEVPLGGNPDRQLWTDEEDSLLIKSDHLPAQEIAALLNRPPRSIQHRRAFLRERKGVWIGGRKGRSWDPTSIGRRRLVAQTCSWCGLLLDSTWFDQPTGTFYRKRCRKCSSVDAVSRRSDDQRLKDRADRDRLQAITEQHAERRGQEWTSGDLSTISHPDLSLFEMALLTKRTLMGVGAARRRAGLTEARMGDPEEAQWIIANSNLDLVAARPTPPGDTK